MIDGGKTEASPETLAWFVVQCTHRTEFAIVDGLAENRIVAYCPAETRWRTSRLRRDRFKLALLPGYLFVGLERDRHGDYPFPAVHAIDGVVGILGVSGAPVQIAYGAPDPEFERTNRQRDQSISIAELRAMEDAGTFDLTRETALTEAAKRRAKKTLKSFTELAQALSKQDAA